jgi:hypothetical protein
LDCARTTCGRNCTTGAHLESETKVARREVRSVTSPPILVPRKGRRFENRPFRQSAACSGLGRVELAREGGVDATPGPRRLWIFAERFRGKRSTRTLGFAQHSPQVQRSRRAGFSCVRGRRRCVGSRCDSKPDSLRGPACRGAIGGRSRDSSLVDGDCGEIRRIGTIRSWKCSSVT